MTIRQAVRARLVLEEARRGRGPADVARGAKVQLPNLMTWLAGAKTLSVDAVDRVRQALGHRTTIREDLLAGFKKTKRSRRSVAREARVHLPHLGRFLAGDHKLGFDAAERVLDCLNRSRRPPTAASRLQARKRISA